MRFLLVLAITLLLVPAHATERVVRLAPLAENPPVVSDTPAQAWARAHQTGGTLNDTSLVLLPLAPEYIALHRAAATIPPAAIDRWGPWPDGFLLQFNAYAYAAGEPTRDISIGYSGHAFALHWGDPSSGDNAVIPEPREVLPLTQLGDTGGLWLYAQFPTREAALAFEASPLRQLRVTLGEEIFVIELGAWSGLTLLSTPVLPPLMEPPRPALPSP